MKWESRKSLLQINKNKKTIKINHNVGLNNEKNQQRPATKGIKRACSLDERLRLEKYEAEQFARMDRILSSMGEKIQQNKDLIERNMSYLSKEVNFATLVK